MTRESRDQHDLAEVAELAADLDRIRSDAPIVFVRFLQHIRRVTPIRTPRPRKPSK